MKRFIALFISLLIISSNLVFAEEEQTAELLAPTLPETYFSPSIRLFSTEPTLEDVLVEGWETFATRINISKFNIKVDDLKSIYFGILADHPLIYYAAGSMSYSYNTKGYVTPDSPKYTETDRTKVAETLNQSNEATEEILFLIDDYMTDFEKVMTVHNYMVSNYEYDYTYSISGIQIMLTKKGVCNAYAHAFKHLMNTLGINCCYVSSDEMNHAWNLVEIDGNWYHIDLTWDAPSQDDNYDDDIPPIAIPGQVSNTFALLSDAKIQSLSSPHYNYNTKGLTADSTTYDNASWHETGGSVVTIGKTEYWSENYQIVSSKGEIICSDLDGSNDKWNIGGGYYFTNRLNLTALAEYNKILYYNTDSAIMSYNPKTKETKTVKLIEGVCGLYINHNDLVYCMYDMDTGFYKESGTIHLGDIRIGGVVHKNGKTTTRVYKDASTPITVYSYGDNHVQMQTVEKTGLSTITFDTESEQSIFFWNNKMQPLTDKKVFK